MTTPYFHAGPDGFSPTPSAVGPWSADMLHGRLLGGLAARAIEAELGEAPLRIARLTVDLFRPAAMAPVQVACAVVREGRRIRVVDAVLTSEGHDVGRVTAVALAVSEAPPGRIWQPEHFKWPHYDDLREQDEERPDAIWIHRTVQGGFNTGEQTRVWTNDTAPLVDDELMTPVVRAAVSADIACPLANSSDEGLYYINADYTLALGRHPVGDWIGLEVSNQIAESGISMAMATLVDERGPFGTSTGVSLANPPLESSNNLR